LYASLERKLINLRWSHAEMYWNAITEEYMPQIYIAMFAPTAGVSCEPSEYTMKCC
jgi:hypothetical protein